MSEQKSCSELVEGSLDSRMEEITALWKAYCSGKEDVEDLGNIYEYGLSFDYVTPHTFREQERGYFRYQISWGGPSEEFRFYCWEGFTLDKIEFWYLDWFDGAKKNLTGDYLTTMKEIFEWFKEAGSVQSEYDNAMADYEEPDDDDDDDDMDDEEPDEEVDE